MKILIVEDQLSVQEELKFILGEYGEIDTANNGRIGVETFHHSLANGSSYDLVLLDIQMPEMNGQEVLKNIRQMERERLPETERHDKKNYSVIFMLTSLNTEEHVVEAFFYGECTDYLTKPVDEEKLLEKMKQHKLLVDPNHSGGYTWGGWGR
jgi:two-component system chemotaxis response regulator CheY